MLLKFEMKNYKSFVDRAVFSMVPAPKQKGLDYSLIKKNVGKKKAKAVCSSVVYGPNAAGKTSIIGAMDTFKSIVLNGNIRNPLAVSSPNPTSARLELIPNSALKEVRPIEFAVEFVEQVKVFEYSLAFEVGVFLDQDYPRRIVREELYIDGKRVFFRSDNLELLQDNEGLGEEILNIAKRGLNPEELFLTSGFKVVVSSEFASIVRNWFENKFIIVYQANSVYTQNIITGGKDFVVPHKAIIEAAKIFGINTNVLAYMKNDDDASMLCSLVEKQGEAGLVPIRAEAYESYGTVRFVNLLPLLLSAFQRGAVLVIDEFDASIHPMALMNIVKIFHNDEVNTQHSQLVFNTHNPIFLNANLFRRDEIKFVERDEDTHESSIYALSDFGTNGPNGVRRREDYMKNYFVSQYGAIRDIDFSDLFQSVVSSKAKVD